MEPAAHEHIRHATFLLLGGGLASATAAETLRREGAEGAIVMVADERDLPYHRPQLSTRFLQDDTAPPPALVLPSDYYSDNNISLLSGVSAIALDPGQRRLQTDHAGTIAYEKLLIATGVRPLRLDIPGGGLPGVHYLRTAADARLLRGAVEGARRAVVVGAGFIALEIAVACLHKGVPVTVPATSTHTSAALTSTRGPACISTMTCRARCSRPDARPPRRAPSNR